MATQLDTPVESAEAWNEQRAIAERLARRGVRQVGVPAFGSLLAGSLLGSVVFLKGYGFWALGFVDLGVIGMIVAYSVLRKRWWRLAVAQGVNTRALQDAGEEFHLVWPRNSFIGRREAAAWKRVTQKETP